MKDNLITFFSWSFYNSSVCIKKIMCLLLLVRLSSVDFMVKCFFWFFIFFELTCINNKITSNQTLRTVHEPKVWSKESSKLLNQGHLEYWPSRWPCLNLLQIELRLKWSATGQKECEDNLCWQLFKFRTLRHRLTLHKNVSSLLAFECAQQRWTNPHSRNTFKRKAFFCSNLFVKMKSLAVNNDDSKFHSSCWLILFFNP